jgi:hypothetical protein
MSSWLYLAKSFVTSSLISNRNELQSTVHAHGGMAAESDKRCYYNKKSPCVKQTQRFSTDVGDVGTRVSSLSACYFIFL